MTNINSIQTVIKTKTTVILALLLLHSNSTVNTMNVNLLLQNFEIHPEKHIWKNTYG